MELVVIANALNMSEAFRPVYTKKRRTKGKHGKNVRFHGAFNGGFSAGFFNTVGSKDGWKPSEDLGGEAGESDSFRSLEIGKKRPLQMKAEDYMDEQDADEWGGAVSLSKAFASNGESNKGRELLKVLGWRDRSYDSTDHEGITYAYVPMRHDEGGEEGIDIIKSKRLKRVAIEFNSQSSRTLPLPKVDTYGMGHDPWKNAPEFKAHRERRRQMAEDRARSATSSHVTGKMGVYRTSDIDTDTKFSGKTDFGFDERRRGKEQKTERESRNHSIFSGGGKQEKSHDEVLAYETTEDFIGSKTVGGFALHDDDDDVYENPLGQTVSSSDQVMNDYNNEAFEASDSDADDFSTTQPFNLQNKAQHDKKQEGDVTAFADALSAWATESRPKNKSGDLKMNSSPAKVHAPVTSDGKPPLSGYVLGGSGDLGNKSNEIKRWPGPNIPDSFHLQRHKFHEKDSIGKMKEMTSAIKRQMISNRRTKDAISSTKQVAEKTTNPLGIIRDIKPMAGTQFSLLSAGLKDRFTSEKSSSAVSGGSQNSSPKKSTFIVRRKVTSWLPAHLVCKRMNVPMPNNVSTLDSQEGQKEKKEEKFFRTEIQALCQGKSSTKVLSHSRGEEIKFQRLGDDMMIVNRPSIDILKSIYEPQSESDMSISSNEEEESIQNGEEKSSQNVNKEERTCPTAQLKDNDKMNQEGIISHSQDETEKGDMIKRMETKSNAVKNKDEGTVSDSSSTSKEYQHRRRKRRKSSRRKEKEHREKGQKRKSSTSRRRRHKEKKKSKDRE